ncbi:unnamed protein product [Brassica oleracea]
MQDRIKPTNQKKKKRSVIKYGKIATGRSEKNTYQRLRDCEIERERGDEKNEVENARYVSSTSTPSVFLSSLDTCYPRTLLFQGVLDNGDVEVLQATGIRTFKGLKMHLMNNPGGINGLSHAKVDKICEEADNIVRIEQLKISIALDARGEGQLNHWKTELIACETRVANMENNN